MDQIPKEVRKLNATLEVLSKHREAELEREHGTKRT